MCPEYRVLKSMIFRGGLENGATLFREFALFRERTLLLSLLWRENAPGLTKTGAWVHASRRATVARQAEAPVRTT